MHDEWNRAGCFGFSYAGSLSRGSDVGDSSVDTGDGQPSPDRVSGENDDPWAVMLELTYNL